MLNPGLLVREGRRYNYNSVTVVPRHAFHSSPNCFLQYMLICQPAILNTLPGSHSQRRRLSLSSDLSRGNAGRLMGRIVYKACLHQSFLHLPVKYELFHLEVLEIFFDLTESRPEGFDILRA